MSEPIYPEDNGQYGKYSNVNNANMNNANAPDKNEHKSEIIIGICGLGFVGNAVYQTFKDYYDVVTYDKYKNNGCVELLFKSKILFLCLPTPYEHDINKFNTTELNNTLEFLNNHEQSHNPYTGLIVIKSTVEPTFTRQMAEKYPHLSIIHNPEFLTARTAVEDFRNQKHIVLGRTASCSNELYQDMIDIYSHVFPNAQISQCESTDSEMMKLCCNTFYAIKVQIFNEYYDLCHKLGVNYNHLIEMMLKNGWINPMHTQCPGPDGQLSYGGYCFPKDTNALNSFMGNMGSIHEVLDACISERNKMRPGDT